MSNGALGMDGVWSGFNLGSDPAFTMSVSPEKRAGKRPRLGKFEVARQAASPPGDGIPPDAPGGMKRSTKVVLAMAGTAALVTYMATREPVCKQPDPNDWNAPVGPQPCRKSWWSSSGGSWRSTSGWSDRSTSTNRPASGTTQGVVSRGGFGATGSAISVHGGS